MTAPVELPAPLPEPDPPRELTFEQRFAAALRQYIPPLGRRHRRTVMLPALLDLYPRIEAAMREGVPPRLVLEVAASEGLPAVSETAEHALRALDRGHPVEEVLEVWSLILDEHWSHLGPGCARPALPASSAASLRIHAEWVNRIMHCRRLTDEVATLTSQERMSALIVGGLPLVVTFLIQLINPAFTRRIAPAFAPVLGVFIVAWLVTGWLMARAARRVASSSHPFTAFLATFTAHLDAGAEPGDAYERAAPALGARASTLPAVVDELRARGIDPDPLAPVAVLLALPVLAPAVRARAVGMLYERARELEKSRTALSIAGFGERAVWLYAAGAASLATTCVVLLREVLGPLLY